jgi:WD40 repeat protein
VLWNLPRHGLLRGFEHRFGDWVQYHLNSVALSPDGSTLATGAADKTVRMWHVKSGEPRGLLPEHPDAVSAVAFSPDGQTLVAGTGDPLAPGKPGEV